MFTSFDSLSYKVFLTVNMVILIGLAVFCILPFVHLFAISLSADGPSSANQVGLVPVGFNLEAYKEALSDSRLLSTFSVSLQRVFFGVILNMSLTVLVAYPLSQETQSFPGRNIYTWLLVFTMIFNGGLIPMYMLVNQLGLSNTLGALVLPTAVNVFFVVILLNFFRQIPKELEEASFIDGASYFTTLIRVYLPLSLPSIATLTLFSILFHWNQWFDGLLYINDPAQYPLQTYLHILVDRVGVIVSMDDARRMMEVSQRSLISAQIIVSMLPIVCVYPFLQKYIKSGLVLGSVKG
jgi:putative aldouronate transport system permease protein